LTLHTRVASVRRMRAALGVIATVLVLGAGCGGGDASRREACEHVCGCLTFSTPQAGQDCVLECIDGNSGVIELPSQACVNCAAEATCGGIANGTACAVECDNGSS
jgi:hypothetical protein